MCKQSSVNQEFNSLQVTKYFYNRIKTKETSEAAAESLHHEYNYISEVPQRQLPNASYINKSLSVARPEIDRQYKCVGRNLTDYPWMYNTPEQKCNRSQIKQYENTAETTVSKHPLIRFSPPALKRNGDGTVFIIVYLFTFRGGGGYRHSANGGGYSHLVDFWAGG